MKIVDSPQYKSLQELVDCNKGEDVLVVEGVAVPIVKHGLQLMEKRDLMLNKL